MQRPQGRDSLEKKENVHTMTTLVYPLPSENTQQIFKQKAKEAVQLATSQGFGRDGYKASPSPSAENRLLILSAKSWG